MASAFEGFKLKRSRSVDSSQQEPLDLTVDFYFEIFVSGSPEIFASGLMKSRSAKSQGREDCVGHRISKVDRWRIIDTKVKFH
jgi:hypothetical protein